MKKKSSVKFIVMMTVLALSLISANTFYLLATGRHFVSQTNIGNYAVSRDLAMRQEVIAADRGRIIDSEGVVLASDVYLYKLIAVLSEERPSISGNPAYVKDKETTANALAPILETTPDIILSYLKQESYQVELGVYGSRLDYKKVEQIKALNLPGIEFEPVSYRHYSSSTLAPFIVGFAQYDSEQDQVIGRMGIEALYDEELNGTNGKRSFLADASGYRLPNAEQTIEPAKNGNDVYLTIDIEVQRILDLGIDTLIERLGAEAAWGLIMDAKTGAILASTTRPSFDLETKSITDYIDRTVNYAYEPGSVMKPFVYASAITDGVYPYDGTYQSGKVEVPGGFISDANQGKGWGNISFDEGLMRSSNTGIANLLQHHLKPDSYATYMDKLGFFKKTGVEVTNEAAGNKNYQYLIDQIATGYGQTSSFTAMQIVQAFSVFANNGRMVKPYLVDKIIDPNTNEVVHQHKTEMSEPIFSEEAIKKVNELMEAVAYDERGTAKSYAMDDVRILAKTGTAEIADHNGYIQGVTLNSVVSLFPAEDPQYILYIALEKPKTEVYRTFGLVFQDVVRRTLAQLKVYASATVIDNGNLVEFEMPNVLNHSINYAKQKLSSNGANFTVFGEGQTVLSQSPAFGELISNKDRVYLVSDQGPYIIPNMTGWSIKDAQRLLTALNIPYTMEGMGFVVSQSIAPDTPYDGSSSIQLVLQ